MYEKTWSTFQNAIFAFVSTMLRNMVIIARAGCGKTTTIVECAKRLDKKQFRKIVFASFSTTIVKELVTRLAGVADAKSIHSLGFAMIRKAFRFVKVDEYKGRNIAQIVLVKAGKVDASDKSKADPVLTGKLVKLASLAKNTLAENHGDFVNLATSFDICDNGDNVEEFELLRSQLEKRLLQRLSIAQVVKRLVKEALLVESD